MYHLYNIAIFITLYQYCYILKIINFLFIGGQKKFSETLVREVQIIKLGKCKTLTVRFGKAIEYRISIEKKVQLRTTVKAIAIVIVVTTIPATIVIGLVGFKVYFFFYKGSHVTGTLYLIVSPDTCYSMYGRTQRVIRHITL